MGNSCILQNKTNQIKHDLNIQTDLITNSSKLTSSNHLMCFYFNNSIPSTIKGQVISIPLLENLFENLFLQEINTVRTKPKEYAHKLKAMMNIFDKNNNSLCLSFPKTEKIILSNVEESFKLTIDYLQTIEPMQQLEWDERLKIQLYEEKPFLKNATIFKLMIKKKAEIKDLYSIVNFNIDFTNHPISSCIAQITGDINYNYDRRNVILNPHFSSFAVSYIKDPVRNFISVSTFA